MKIRNTRLSIVMWAITLVFLVLVGRLFQLTVINYTNNSKKKYYTSRLQRRNDILDKNGFVIATDVEVDNLYLNRDLLDSPRQTAKILGEALNIDTKNIYDKITRNRARFIMIKRHLTPAEKLAVKKLGIAATSFEKDLVRVYPQNNLFSHIVGYTDVDRNGIAGLEKYYDSTLKDINGNALRLTMDRRIQTVVRDELLNLKKKFNPEFLVAIVMNIKTGDVVAATAVPDFNPNRIGEDNIHKFNPLTYGRYEMGSVFKIFTLASAFENNVVNKDTVIAVGDNIVYGNDTIRDGRQVKKKNLTVSEIFSLSSNIGAAHIAKQIGIDRHLKMLDKLGLLEKIPTDLYEVSLPLQPRIFKEVNLVTASYGYGIAVSPLHVAMASAAILNDGVLRTPRFSYNYQEQISRRVCSNSTSSIMKELFRKTILEGTGRRADAKGYNVGGKTGTAEKIGKSGYSEKENRTSFVAAFPMDDPAYLIFIMVEKPESQNTMVSLSGGSVISSSIVNIITQIAPLLNIKPRWI